MADDPVLRHETAASCPPDSVGWLYSVSQTTPIRTSYYSDTRRINKVFLPFFTPMCYTCFIIPCFVLSLLIFFIWLDLKFSRQTSTREIALERFNFSRFSWPLLPVEIQGRKYPFTLDTGASISGFDLSFYSLLGEPVQSKIMLSFESKIITKIFFSPAAKLGHFIFPKRSPVFCGDFKKWLMPSGENVYGVLGMDFLKEQIFQIDFDRREVTFLRTVGLDPGVRIPILLDDAGIPQVQLRIPGLMRPEAFQIDTGDIGVSDGVLRTELFDYLCKQRKLKAVGNGKSFRLSSASGIVKVDGVYENSLGCVDDISIGPFRHHNLLFRRLSQESSLGIEFWSRYKVTFDFPNGAIYLKRGCEFYRTNNKI